MKQKSARKQIIIKCMSELRRSDLEITNNLIQCFVKHWLKSALLECG